MEVPPHRRHVYVANARKYLHQACKLEFVYSVLPLMALLNDLGELLPHLPALRPPRLLDLAAGVLMGLMNTLHIQDELVTPHNQDIRSRLEVDWLFFAQDGYVTGSNIVQKRIVNMKGDKTGDAIVRRTLSTRQSSRVPLS
jgi:hypothetical protein